MNSSSPEILLVDDSQNDVDLTLHTLARIIHIFEENKSLLCYKHVG
jgi:hypothetical protein